MTSTAQHTKDTDCIIDQTTLCCTGCGVEHGEPCPGCGRRAFHRAGCFFDQPDDQYRLRPSTRRVTAITRKLFTVTRKEVVTRGPDPYAGTALTLKRGRLTLELSSVVAFTVRASLSGIRGKYLCTEWIGSRLVYRLGEWLFDRFEEEAYARMSEAEESDPFSAFGPYFG